LFYYFFGFIKTLLTYVTPKSLKSKKIKKLKVKTNKKNRKIKLLLKNGPKAQAGKQNKKKVTKLNTVLRKTKEDQVFFI
jgi:hypothetical protein